LNYGGVYKNNFQNDRKNRLGKSSVVSVY